MTRAALVATALLAVSLAAPASAVALVQLDEGIAGARLGNSRADVRAALGSPDRVRRGTNDFGPFLEFRYRGGIRVTFQGRREVTGVSTSGRGDRTTRGVGVGSREAAVRARVPGVTCETVGDVRFCRRGGVEPGERVTDFLISRGRVTRVTVGIIID